MEGILGITTSEEAWPGLSIVRGKLLCQGQGLARSLPPTAVVRRNSTAIDSHSLLMYTSVLSGTFVTGSC